MSPIPSRCRGRSGASRSSSRGRPRHDLVHLRLVLPQRASDRDPVAAAGGDHPRRLDPQVLLDAALHDPVHRLCRRTFRGVPAQAPLEPTVRALGRARRVVARGVERRALVEHERDIGAERRLHRHRRLRAEEPLGPIDIGAEPDALLIDSEDRPGALGGDPPPALDLVGDRPVTHREHLEAARVGDDRAWPPHELVQPAELADQLRPRRKKQMKRVAEHHLVAEALDVPRLERLYGATRRERHERRRPHRPARELERPRPGARIRRPCPDAEHS